ncbi:MAG: hypothetical protein QQW96_14045 [Tychonema bourrellyi B0820]|uniref:hypothetical protein n=1 Tax=Tychonema bourrellyi TaxID=54313 RepID=UPI0015D503DA|nr:hypothetical protein [Tychonema bourrellyi]MDQ2098758.1 hypothetical protein [Tychonema bourrellyi B0820]
MLAKPAKILRNAIAFLTTNRGGVMKGDRTFEPQIHADGRGWGKGRFICIKFNSSIGLF